MAMAAIMPMIATTISNSISEKPSCRFFLIDFQLLQETVALSSALDRILHRGVRFLNQLQDKNHASNNVCEYWPMLLFELCVLVACDRFCQTVKPQLVNKKRMESSPSSLAFPRQSLLVAQDV